jgi:hypothetical protein
MLAKPFFPILGLVLAAVCVLGLALAGLGAFSRSGSEAPADAATAPATLSDHSPIDDAAPTGIKTATFALG